ncbi:MAG: 2TM domain-containing protein [Candidatus Methanomethylophilaceae archaeon]|nr:2TM domain-containing protein [Candidatus Methanomethylophilaceae archaeon]
MSHDEHLFELAKIRVEKKREFFTHLVAYLLVNGIFWTLYLYTTPTEFPWPVFITAFWGIGVGAHAFDTFMSDDSYSDAVEKEYQKLLQRRR